MNQKRSWLGVPNRYRISDGLMVIRPKSSATVVVVLPTPNPPAIKIFADTTLSVEGTESTDACPGRKLRNRLLPMMDVAHDTNYWPGFLDRLAATKGPGARAWRWRLN
jgi:hypothetical protein